MLRCDGFGTLEEAKAFQKKNGGYICWEQRTPKRKQLTQLGKDYMYAAQAIGLDTEKYPYMVQKRV